VGGHAELCNRATLEMAHLWQYRDIVPFLMLVSLSVHLALFPSPLSCHEV